MTDRYSNPSGSLGQERFYCWPAGTDSYNYTNLTANWDEADGIIGSPSDGSQWPPTTGIDAGIYWQIVLLQQERAPIGSLKFLFMPNDDTLNAALAVGYAVANGQTIASDAHDFPGVTTDITLPNLLNQFICGADPTLDIGAAGVSVNSGNINSPLGAPGPQGSGGSNNVIQTEAQLAAHSHGGETGSWGTDSEGTSPGGLNVMHGYESTGEIGDHSHTIESDGSSAPMENRPLYTGLVPLIKVAFAT